MEASSKKERIFENLLNMTSQPLIVGKSKKKSTGASKKELLYHPTIFSALNHANTLQSVIKVNPGLYNQSLIIKKNDLKIQASEISQNSILINEQFINIVIDLNGPNQKVMIESLKIANASQNPQKHEIKNQDFQSLKFQNYKGFKVGMSINCCIYVKKGILQLDQCKISMAAYHNQQILMPCIIVQRQGTLIINRSQIRGGEGTVGIICKNGQLIIKQSIIREHGGPGILCIGNKQTNISVKNSSISKCKQGITVCGPFQGIIESNIITECGQAGLVIFGGNKLNIIDNQLFQCKVGIQIKNAFPIIAKNNIYHSKQVGIQSISTNSYYCRPVLKFNEIKQNAKGGIMVQGTLNESEIIGNTCQFNNIFGIKVRRRAKCHIFMNKILKTLGDGVYICENSSGFVQKNQISDSLKCNIVLEGPNNIDNFIYNNKIQNSRGEGIFAIYGQKYFIKKNIIKNNHNGIVSLTGVLNIETNNILQNQANGILLIQDNNVQIKNNQIAENRKAGIFVRNTSIAQILDNNFHNNRYQVVVENDDPNFQNIQTTNQFKSDSDIRLPKNYRCQLI